MASSTGKPNVDWSANVALLKKVNIEDSVFWGWLKELAVALRNHGLKHINDHHQFGNGPPRLVELSFVGVCQQSHLGKLYTSKSPDSYRKSQDAPAWAFNGEGMCKNPLYIENGVVHTNMGARGYTLTYGYVDMLARGEKVIQRHHLGLDEITFILPTELFVQTMNTAPTYRVTSIEDLYGLVSMENVERLSNDVLLSLKSHAQLKESIGMENAKLTFFEWCDDGDNKVTTKLQTVSDNPSDPEIKVKIVTKAPSKADSHENCYCGQGHTKSTECDAESCKP